MMKAMMTRFIREEDGAAASEYAILVAFIAAAVAAAVVLFNLGDIFGTVSNQVINLIGTA